MFLFVLDGGKILGNLKYIKYWSLNGLDGKFSHVNSVSSFLY